MKRIDPEEKTDPVIEQLLELVALAQTTEQTAWAAINKRLDEIPAKQKRVRIRI